MKDIFEVYKGRIPESVTPLREYAVMIIFVEKDGRQCLLLERRAAHMDSQPGEICFPGGMREGNETLLQTALRETYEEIGLDSSLIRVAGQGDTLFGYANYNLYTFVGSAELSDLETLTLNREEVDEVLLLPFDEFAKEAPENYVHKIYTDVTDFPVERVGIGKDYPWRTGTWNIPVYKIEGETVWGLTAQIIWKLTETLTGIHDTD